MRNNNIKIAEKQDLPEILKLQRKAFLPVAKLMDNFNLPPLLQSIEELEEEFAYSILMKYEEEGQIIGSVRGNWYQDTVCYIGKLIVDPDYQNRGIGRALMEAVEEAFKVCETYTLFTGSDTPNTFYLYQKLGYKEISREINNGIEMIFMEKKNR